MDSEEILRENEENLDNTELNTLDDIRAAEDRQFVSRVSGKSKAKGKGKFSATSWLGKFGAAGFVTAIVLVFGTMFASGNIIPDAISERLIEETDVQYADAVESKKLVFQQAMYDGYLPDDTVAILNENGYLVGYFGGYGFIEDNKAGVPLALKKEDKVITADGLLAELKTNVDLYDAFNESTYSRAAYYFDESAMSVFRKIGTNRDNYSLNSIFDDVMDKKVGKGSNIDFNTVVEVEKTRINEDGEEETYYEYEEDGPNAESDALDFIQRVSDKNWDKSVEEATMNSADAIKVADTISKEQRSSLYYLTFMENISKMKAGDGNESKINEAMNYLHTEGKSVITDIETGRVFTVTGTPLESPSLYAVLSGSETDLDLVKHYSSDRVLKLIESRMSGASGSKSIDGTIASTEMKVKGSIGRLILFKDARANGTVLASASQIVSSSLVNNSFDTIEGINAGEFLVEGAINVGKELAKRSGGAAGDQSAVLAYTKLNNEILAMDAKVDRMKRSPFDITSKNTFLGSIIYKVAVMSSRASGFLSTINTVASTVGSALLSVIPGVHAEDSEGYLTNFGNCETYSTIAATGSTQCAEIATFDVTTLDDPFNDPKFISFVNRNTILDGAGNRIVVEGTPLARYILYNNERITPLGVKDGGIIESLINDSTTIPFVSSILKLILLIFGIPKEYEQIATGEMYVNTAGNMDWQETYKYAQRYVSLARAKSALQQYTKDKTAYTNMKFFEGDYNPVIAFLNNHYQLANK